MRRNGQLAADFARRHGVPRWYDDADAIIDASDIDAVYIATLTYPSRLCRTLRGGRQGGLCRKADGNESRPMLDDDRGVPLG